MAFVVCYLLATVLPTAGPPPLLDPESTPIAEVRGIALDPQRRLEAAESLLLLGEPAEARALLESHPASGDREEARVLRLQLDAEIQLGRVEAARARAQELAGKPGWLTHAAWSIQRMEAAELERSRARFGLVLFALAMGGMLLGGGAELLRPRASSLGFIVASLVGAALIFGVAPLLGRVLLMADLAVLALIHAASSAAARHQPGPKGRLLLATSVLVGAIGAGLGIFSALPLPLLLGRG